MKPLPEGILSGTRPLISISFVVQLGGGGLIEDPTHAPVKPLIDS